MMISLSPDDDWNDDDCDDDCDDDDCDDCDEDHEPVDGNWLDHPSLSAEERNTK